MLFVYRSSSLCRPRSETRTRPWMQRKLMMSDNQPRLYMSAVFPCNRQLTRALKSQHRWSQQSRRLPASATQRMRRATTAVGLTSEHQRVVKWQQRVTWRLFWLHVGQLVQIRLEALTSTVWKIMTCYTPKCVCMCVGSNTNTQWIINIQ